MNGSGVCQRITQRFFPTEAGSTASLASRLLRRMPAPTAYLEVGIASGKTFTRVDADRSVGVDPSPEAFNRPDWCTVHEVTSSTYFRDFASRDSPFSVVFVDGLHLWEACLEDILESFEHLQDSGFVIVDDVYPSGVGEAVRAQTYEDAARIAHAAGRSIDSWMGDVWRALFVLTHARVPGLRWATVPISRDRFHTVFWWATQGQSSRAIRELIAASRLWDAEDPDVSAIGDFTRSGIAKWYRYMPYWRFLLSLRFREFLQTMRRFSA